jgi:hypothetical protein
MTGLVRKATFLAVCGLLTAGAAMAHVPDPANSECNNVGATSLGLVSSKAIVYVSGNSGGVPDPISAFCVTVRDFNNVPIENSSVVLDFAACDLQLCINPLDPDAIVDCVSQTVRKLTDVNGVACFKVMGKTRQGLGCAGAPKDCFKVFADGVFLCSGDAPTLDLVNQNGQDGLTAADLSAFLQLWLVCGNSLSRGNYSCQDQILTAADLSVFLKLWLVAAGSVSNCAGAKDPQVGPKCP